MANAASSARAAIVVEVILRVTAATLLEIENDSHLHRRAQVVKPRLCYPASVPLFASHDNYFIDYCSTGS
jgi:hypothetical protein